MKQKIILFIAVISGLLAVFLSATIIARKKAALEEERLKLNQREMISVVVLRESRPAGSRIQESLLAKKSFPAEAISRRAIIVTKENQELIIARLTGRILTAGVEKGKPMMWNDIQGGSVEDGGLASSLRSRMRALSISVSGAASVSNMVRPSDRVDVLGTFTLPSKTIAGETELVTLTILQNVVVLATGQETTETYNGIASNYGLVTLEVTPSEAEVLTFAEQMRGRLTLTLRSPTDTSYESSLPSVNFEEVRSKLEEMNRERQNKKR
ncbi:MAG: Flp pilus assembly protein CpaB [bacterium]|nr:Flp pilus assembly protein CpaB [bacterium]